MLRGTLQLQGSSGQVSGLHPSQGHARKGTGAPQQTRFGPSSPHSSIFPQTHSHTGMPSRLHLHCKFSDSPREFFRLSQEESGANLLTLGRTLILETALPRIRFLLLTGAVRHVLQSYQNTYAFPESWGCRCSGAWKGGGRGLQSPVPTPPEAVISVSSTKALHATQTYTHSQVQGCPHIRNSHRHGFCQESGETNYIGL